MDKVKNPLIPKEPPKMTPEELQALKIKAKLCLREAIGMLCSRDILLGYLLCSIDTNVGNVGTACASFRHGSFSVTVDPIFFTELKDTERTAVLEHEALHVLHLHMLRMDKRDWLKWNLACDMAINPFIEGLPKSALLPEDKDRGKAAEEIYDNLKIKTIEIKLFDFFDKADGAPSEVVRGSVEKLFKDISNVTGASEEEVKKMVEEKLQEAKASMSSHSRGVDPGTTMLDIVAEKSSFEVALRAIMSMRSDDYRRTLKRPHRRLDGYPWGRRREEQTRIVVAVDNSGSVSRQLLNRFFGEILKLQNISNDVQVIICDSRVQSVFRLRSEADFKKISGGGGTDYNPAIKRANKLFRDYDVMLYLTDGECPLPQERSIVPLIWIITDAAGFEGKPMIWAPELSTG